MIVVDNIKNISNLNRVLFLFPVLLLLLIWSISGTVALRHFLLLALVLVNYKFFDKETALDWCRRFSFLFLLTAWFVSHALFITSDAGWVWSEITSQWLRAIIVCLLGAMVAKSFVEKYGTSAGKFFSWLCLIMGLVYGSLVLLTSAYYWLDNRDAITGFFPFTFSARGGKLEVSFVLSIALALVAVDVIQGFLKRKTILGLSLRKICFVAFFLVVAMLFAGARNALIGVLFLALSGTFMWFLAYANKRKALLILFPVFLLLAVFVYFAISMDQRWQYFHETLLLALDTDHHSAWLTRVDYPVMASGRAVDVSAYERISWIKVGAKLFWNDYMFGYGYGREVFGHALMAKFGASAGGHSHSGYIDLLLAGGLPAIVLWLGFVFSFIATVVKTYRRSHSPYALFLFFVLMGFNGRMLLDSVWRDHYLQLHFFIVAALWIILLSAERNLTSNFNENTGDTP